MRQCLNFCVMFDAAGEATYTDKPRISGLNLDSRMMDVTLRVRLVAIAARIDAGRQVR